MRKMIRLAIAGAFLMVALAAPRAATAHHTVCEYWYDAFGNCYYSCPGHGDGYC